MITIEKLRALLHYDPNTGVFTRLRRTSSKSLAGMIAGFKINDYRRISIDHQEYYEHRLAWFYMTGKWPITQIDHINLNKSDNRWVNLREATNGQNGANRPAQKNNTSGFKGVTFHKPTQLWRAAVKKNGINSHIGYFDTPEAAHVAYARAAESAFGKFARS